MNLFLSLLSFDTKYSVVTGTYAVANGELTIETNIDIVDCDIRYISFKLLAPNDFAKKTSLTKFTVWHNIDINASCKDFF